MEQGEHDLSFEGKMQETYVVYDSVYCGGLLYSFELKAKGINVAKKCFYHHFNGTPQSFQ